MCTYVPQYLSSKTYSLFLSQPASVMATARAWTAVCASSAVTSPLALTARPACLVTMETRPMAANARVSAASPQMLNYSAHIRLNGFACYHFVEGLDWWSLTLTTLIICARFLPVNNQVLNKYTNYILFYLDKTCCVYMIIKLLEEYHLLIEF